MPLSLRHAPQNAKDIEEDATVLERIMVVAEESPRSTLKKDALNTPDILRSVKTGRVSRASDADGIETTNKEGRNGGKHTMRDSINMT